VTSTLAPPALPDVVDDGSRREFLAAGLAVALGLAGCGDDDPAAGRPADDGFPRTVRGSDGPVRIHARPQRPAVLLDNAGEADTLLALGLRPRAVSLVNSQPSPWAQRAGGFLETYRFVEEVDVERIAASRPDLVVGEQSRAEPVLDELRRIAPTIPVDPAIGWRRLTELLGRATGREAQAAAVIERTAERIAQTRSRLAGRFDRVAMFFATSEGPFVYARGGASTSLLEQFGLPISEPPTPPGEDLGAVLSLERVGEIEVDRLIAIDPYAETSRDLDRLLDQRVVRRLRVVREGRLLRLDRDASLALIAPSVLSIPVLANALERGLA